MGRRPIGTPIDFPPTPLRALRVLCGKRKSLTEVTELRELCVKSPFATEVTEKDEREPFSMGGQWSIGNHQSPITNEVLRG